MYKAQFTLDCIDETEGSVTPFKGYTHGDHWNGWATPYFARDEAQRVAAALNKVYANPHYAWYDRGQDAFANFYEGDDPNDIEEWHGKQVEVDGQMLTLYAIGAYCWTWNSYEPE